ncbi:MAG: NBR1-Ig-like domain-containing protein [Chloroflexota bacterium]
MKYRLSFVSAAVLVALLFSFLPMAGTTVQSVAAATYCDAAQFVADVTVPDGAVYAPGATFKKTWRLKNIGTCTWTTGYSLVYASGEKMGTVTAVALPSNVAPGQTVDVSVDLTAPASAGKYRGNWQLANASGVKFGIGSTAQGVFWVEIVVSSGGGTAAGVVYNFADKACDAAWSSAAGALPCPGTDGDAKGFVLKQANPKLENGVADASPGLLVAPQAVYNGYVQAVYPAFKVQSGDRFQVTVSCEGGATSCYVAYRLDYQIGSGAVQTFWTFREKFEGQYYRANLDLSRLAGQDVKFILHLSAYGDPTGDRALWANPVIYRQGSGGVTPVPTTPVPGTGCDKAQFVADVTVPDGTVFAPGATFKKTWRLKNIGTCTWTTGYSLVFSNGEKMGGPTSAPFPTAVAPGQTVDLTVNLTAPTASGTFRGNWMLTNATSQVFGIGTGANKPFWVEIKVTGGPTVTPGTPSPTPTGPTPTQPADTAYDFVAKMCDAKWVSGAGTLPCPGTDNDAKGFVLKLTSPQLETGAVDPRPGLLTNPQNTTNGYIQGIYPAFRVQTGDRFQSIVNCQYNATSCYVIFRLDYQIGEGTPKTFWTFGERYEGQYYQVNLDLSSLAGQDVKFILTVMAGTYATGDRAVWVGPRIYRAGGSGSAPLPSATPTVTVTSTSGSGVSPSATATATATATTSSAAPDISNWTLFQNTKYKFQFMVPPASTVTSQSDMEARIDLPFTQGTLLTSKYINLTVVEGVSPCKNTVASGAPPTSSENVTINGIVFLKETGSEPAAGNLFEWEAYSVVRPNTNACVSIGFVLRSSNPGNFSTPPPPFDKAAESAIFQTILSTVAWIP